MSLGHPLTFSLINNDSWLQMHESKSSIPFSLSHSMLHKSKYATCPLIPIFFVILFDLPKINFKKKKKKSNAFATPPLTTNLSPMPLTWVRRHHQLQSQPPIWGRSEVDLNTHDNHRHTVTPLARNHHHGFLFCSPATQLLQN